MPEHRVVIVMGSESDLGVAEKAFPVLERMGIEFDVRVLSAHRSPEAVRELAAGAEGSYAAVIAVAGAAAHLGGVLASHTTVPVIGVPVASTALGGLDALLATVQMPSGVPVATVAIGGAANAAVLAAQIIAAGDPGLREKLRAYREELAAKVARSDAGLRKRLGR